MNQHRLPAKDPLPTRLIIADDHELARSGMRSMLEGVRWLTVVGEAADGYEAVDLCRSTRPDLALLDVRMPGLDGIAATTSIAVVSPQTRVLIITTHEHPDYLLAARKAGAFGYLLKDVTRADLLSTIQSVRQGELLLSAAAVPQVQAQKAACQGRTGPPERLTPREREVLALIVEGCTNREIAGRLSLSVGTAKIHVEHIIAKLEVADRTQAAVRAVEQGLLKPTGS